MRPCRATLFASLAMLAIGLSFAPQARAQANVLYFPASGHFLDDTAGFLSFWQSHSGERVLGFPIAEAQTVDGLAQQYFERGRIEQATDPANGVVQVRVGRVGAEYAEAVWKTFPAAPKRQSDSSAQVFETTGHSIRAPFLAFWQANGAEPIFGQPLGEAAWEVTERGRRLVQYFERVRLERDANQTGTESEIIVADLGRLLATLRGLTTDRLANNGAAEYGPAAASAARRVSLDVPTPAPATPTPRIVPVVRPPAVATAAPQRSRNPEPRTGKYIVVNLSDQWLYAYEDGDQVFSAPVSTGRDGMDTPTGTFAIYDKIAVQTMDGVLDGKAWVVPNVPNVMYIHGGVALHGTYWHNRFGTGARLSHGCINLPLKSAAWVYKWAPIGTTVRVTN